MRALAVALVLLTGCLKPDLQSCGTRLCAADSVCLPDGTCATKESVDACIDHLEGAACTTSFFTGSCESGVCTAARCGDGVVSGSEQCDGSVSGVDCVDYGFDTGVPTCSSLCALDVVGSCVRFGWKRVVPQSASRAWTNGSLFAFVSPDGKQTQIWRDGALLESATPSISGEYFYSLSGTGSTVVANTYSTIVRSDSGGPFVDVPTTGLPQTYMHVSVGDDGTIYVIAFYDANAEVYRSTASGFQQILSLPQPVVGARFTGGALYLMISDGTVRRYANGGWSGTLFTAPGVVGDVAELDGVLYVAVNTGAFEFVNGALIGMSSDSCNTVVALPSGIYFGAGDTVVMRFKDNTKQMFFAPIYGYLFSDGTDVYTFGSGIYRFTGTEWSDHPGIGEPATDVSLLADSNIAITSVSEIFVDAGPYSWTYNTAAEPEPIAIAGRSIADYYVTGGTVLEHFNGSGFALVTVPAGIPAMTDLAWDDVESTLYVVGALGLGMKLVGTTWTRFSDIAGCDLDAVFLEHNIGVFAAGTCGSEGVLWSLAGTTWTEIHRSSFPLVSVWVDRSSNIYAAGPQGGVTRVAGTWKDEPRAKGVSISATSPSDIWVGGGPDDVLHWDGTLWSRVAVVGPATPHVWATPSTVYVAGAKQTMLLR